MGVYQREDGYAVVPCEPLSSWHCSRLAIRQDFAAKRIQACRFEVIAIEHVVGVERDEALAVGVGDVDAGLLDGAEVEGLGVDELDDEDAEEIFVDPSLRTPAHCPNEDVPARPSSP